MTAVPSIDDLFSRFLEHQNEEDLGAVFDLAAPELAAMARRARLDAAGCEDALQETFLTILRRSRSFAAGRRFMPWAQGIMARQIKVERRRQSQRLAALGLGTSDVNADLAPGPRQVLEDSELRRQIEEAIAGLSSTHRDVVGGALLDGESASDLALKMGLSINTVAVRLHRGLHQIRKVLPKAAVLGAAGLMTARARGEASLRSSITRAARNRTFEIVGPQAWWLSPAAIATAAGIGALAAGGWALRSNIGSGAGTYMNASLITRTSGHRDATPPDLLEKTVDRLGREVAASTATDPPAEDGESAAAMRPRIQVLAPDGRPAGAGTEVFLLRTEPRVVLPTEPIVPFAMTDGHGQFLAPTEIEAGDASPLLYARSARNTPGLPALAGILAVDLEALPAEGDVLRLTEALTLEFEVRDEAGQPVEGVDVAALGLIDELFSDEAQRALDQGTLWPIGYRHLFGGVTDELGRCSVTGFLTQKFNGAWICSAAAWKDGHAAYVEGFEFGLDEPTRLTFTLPRLDSIELSGEVVDQDGHPLAGTSIHFNYRGIEIPEDSGVGVTKADGRWSLDPSTLNWFPIELRFEHEGYVTSEFHVSRPSRLQASLQADLKSIVMSPSVSLRGQLIGADGQPAAGELTLVELGRINHATAGRDGTFAFEGLRGGRGVLTAIGAGSASDLAVQDVESFGEPIRVTLSACETAQDVTIRVIDPRSGDPIPISEVALLRNGETTGAWPFVHLEEGTGHAKNLPPGHWSAIAMLEEDGRAVSLDIEIPASEEPQFVDIPAVEDGLLGLTVNGAPGLDTSQGKVVIARALGPEIPLWARASNELASYELALDMYVDITQGTIWAMPGLTDVLVHGQGWATAPVRCKIRPGETTRLDLQAIPSGQVILRFPALDAPGCVTLEVSAAEGGLDSREWFKVTSEVFAAHAVGEYAVQLPPGRWKWRGTCGAFLDEVRTHRAIPQRTGVMEVLAGETVEISMDAP